MYRSQLNQVIRCQIQSLQMRVACELGIQFVRDLIQVQFGHVSEALSLFAANHYDDKALRNCFNCCLTVSHVFSNYKTERLPAKAGRFL